MTAIDSIPLITVKVIDLISVISSLSSYDSRTIDHVAQIGRAYSLKVDGYVNGLVRHCELVAGDPLSVYENVAEFITFVRGKVYGDLFTGGSLEIRQRSFTVLGLVNIQIISNLGTEALIGYVDAVEMRVRNIFKVVINP